MRQSVAATPLATELAVERLAGMLLETAPGTSDHWNAWGAYRFGVAIQAEMECEQGVSVDYQAVNGAYLSTLAETARRVGAAVIIPPLEWDLSQWRRDSHVLCSAVSPVSGSGTRWEAAAWPDILEGLATGGVRICDRRASTAEFLRFAAFYRLD